MIRRREFTAALAAAGTLVTRGRGAEPHRAAGIKESGHGLWRGAGRREYRVHCGGGVSLSVEPVLRRDVALRNRAFVLLDAICKRRADGKWDDGGLDGWFGPQSLGWAVLEWLERRGAGEFGIAGRGDSVIVRLEEGAAQAGLKPR